MVIECPGVPASVWEWYLDSKTVREQSRKFRVFLRFVELLVFSVTHRMRVLEWLSYIASDSGRTALRVIPRGKQWLAVYRAHQVACRDGEQRSAVLQQYFIEQYRGKSRRKWLADNPKTNSQKWRYLGSHKAEFSDKRFKLRLQHVVSDSESEWSRKILRPENVLA